MSKNIIFTFTGTGNSLWAAKEIAKSLENCEIASMGKDYKIEPGYDTIGFVYPTYGGGIPRRVRDFITDLDLQGNKDSYYFAVATCGRVARAQNAVTQVRNLLKRKDIPLHYGERLDMYSNYVINYEMRETVREEADQSAIDLEPMIRHIRNHETNDGNRMLTPRQITSIGFMHIVSNMDKGFNVSDACIHCRTCQKVCPVGNIEMDEDVRPRYQHHCEMCLACIQNCPVKAINYKDKTQSRGRYRHPDVSCRELEEFNSNVAR